MICYVHCQQVASVEVVEVEVADLAEVVVEVEVADSAEVEEVVDEEEVEVDIPIITIFYGRDKGGNFIYPMMHRFKLYYQASERT